VINVTGLTIHGEKIKLLLTARTMQQILAKLSRSRKKLVDARVSPIVGHMNSGTSIPASKIYSDASITQISPSSTNPAYTQQSFHTTFHDVAKDAQQGPALAIVRSTFLKPRLSRLLMIRLHTDRA
jgi:branched-chain amino acid transport system substrate-binding protein